jgi:signal transduction histidine kinase/HAMP domain-containing protein
MAICAHAQILGQLVALVTRGCLRGARFNVRIVRARPTTTHLNRMVWLMQRILRLFTSRISNKIILPYLLLALCLAVAMSFVAVRLTAGALQSRMDNRLIEAGQATSDGLVAVEDLQIGQLRAMAFTEGVADALADNDSVRLAALLRPQWANSDLYALVAFDATGRPLLNWQRIPGAGADVLPQAMPAQTLDSWWLVQQIVGQHSDPFGDKFSAFQAGHLYTAAPVRQDRRLVGGLLVGLPLDRLLERLQTRSQASVTTFYDAPGRAVATTQILVGNATVPAVPADVLAQLLAARGSPDLVHIQSVGALNGRDHQFAYSPLRVRRAMSGFFAVALPREFIVDAWAQERVPLVLLALLVVAAVVAVGSAVSRHITRPLQDLVATARAVANGELRRRSSVTSRDELGVVARSFNQMTERLLHLYETSRNLSAHTQIDVLLDQTSAALQPLVPGTVALALLEDRDGWRFYAGAGSGDILASLSQAPFRDSAALLGLFRGADRPVVLPANALPLPLPPGIAEVCGMILTVQGHPIGMLLLIHDHPGTFSTAVMEPLIAIASMAATALHNARLYREVQEEGNRRRVILESIADSVIVCDAERNVVLMNPAAEELLDVRDWAERRYHFDELPLTALVNPNALPAPHDQIQARYRSGDQVLRASGAVLSSPAQALGGEVVVLHNITEEVALDRAKTNLIAMISHELRTPLTVIQGATDMLRQGVGGQLAPQQVELADMALRQTQAMSSLIEKAIVVANIETGTLEFDIRPTDLQMVIEWALDALRLDAEAVGVTFLIDLPVDLPLVLVDQRMLKMALEQVLDNAIKYGKGVVRIGAETQLTGVRLAVSDSGPGIAAEDLPNLFRGLRRGAADLNIGPRGLGLGLLITRELVERQGGAIQVHSQLGHGSRFSLFLPGANDATHAQAA